jgi:hypothetical protein
MTRKDIIGQEKKLGNIIVISIVASVTLMLMNCTRHNPENAYESIEPIADSVYAREGNRIVALTFDTLRNSLLHAIRSRNVDGAVTFCNEQAYPITAIYSDSVSVRRTALRIRNPENSPDSLERSILNSMSNQITTLKIPDEKIARSESTKEIHFFKPIMIQPLCLNCHGTPEKQIQNSTLAEIQRLYPNDQAVGYKEGDLRGVWHIIFNPQKLQPAIKK